jgi:uncharacterized protein (TIGR03790 family)
MVGTLSSPFDMTRILTQVRAVLHYETTCIDPKTWGARIVGLLLGAAIASACAGASANDPHAASAAPLSSASAASAPPRSWIAVRRPAGRLSAADIGLVINTADPYSVEVGAFYAQMRKLGPEQVLHIELPLRATLTPAEFESLAERIKDHFGAGTQALALAWRMPYAVGCNSITGALALGFDAALCAQTCAPTRRSPYFASASARPFADHGMRLSMLLAANSVEAAKALIQRGVVADASLGRLGAPPVHAHFVSTDDKVRSARAALFPPAGKLRPFNVEVHLDTTPALVEADRVLLYLTGRTHVERLDSVGFVPGALADHLTSAGGVLDGSQPQMTALEWIGAGATASYGTVSEPCAHLQKFPHPQTLLLYYLAGSTALEAYWKSVAWPQQGLFVGEPLAAPFARR